MPRTIIANFDAGRIPDVADEANFHLDATYVFEHMASDIIPGINTNMDWMNAALAGAETLVDAVADLEDLVGSTTTFAQTLLDDADAAAARNTLQLIYAPTATGGDFNSGDAVLGGTYSTAGSWINGPFNSGGASPYTGILRVERRNGSAGPAVTQTLATNTTIVREYTRVGTGDPLVFSDWRRRPTTPKGAGLAGQVLTEDGTGELYWGGTACRAWVNFDGTGTPTIRASGNVSSITDNGTGDYTINFTTAMPDADYAWVGSCQTNTTSTSTRGTVQQRSNQTSTTTQLPIQTMTGINGTNAEDLPKVCVSVFR